MNPRPVIIGAGMAGLAAAAAFDREGLEVLVLERDELSPYPSFRRGVPQGGQLHNLLTRAQQHLDDLIPGYTSALRAAGAGDACVSTDTYVYEYGIQMPRRDLGLRLMAARRPVLEDVARQLLAGSGRVEIIGRAEVTGLRLDNAGAISGVTVARDGTTEAFTTPIVVDASGAGSQHRRWLSPSDVQAAPTVTATPGQWYVTTLVKRPPASHADPTFTLVFPTPPRSRGGLASPVDDDHWQVSVSGRRSDAPPRTADELRTYAATLEDPAVAHLLQSATVDAPAGIFNRVRVHWHRYDQVESPIPGLLPLGDAVASLNPLFGQGISVAAWQAALLRPMLAEWRQSGDVEKLTLGYHLAAARVVQQVWRLGDVVEHQLAGVEDIGRRLACEPDLHRRYVQVWHLVESPDNLRAAFA